jgi:hypothetical protein
MPQHTHVCVCACVRARARAYVYLPGRLHPGMYAGIVEGVCMHAV